MSSDSKEARTIVVTGGADGIGRAVVMHCAARGDNLAVLDKNADAAKTAAEEAMKRGAKCALGLFCDVGSEEQVEKAFEIVWDKIGVPYGLFTSAAIDLGGLVHELAAATWRQVLETNLNGTFLTCKHAIRKMRQADALGSIVCASSPAGFVALAVGGAGAYSATKGGISALVRCMAIDYAQYGIRVNAIVPGATETRLMWNNVPAEDIPHMRRVLSKEIPLGRLAQPEEPARAVAWLLSEESSYVRDHTLFATEVFSQRHPSAYEYTRLERQQIYENRENKSGGFARLHTGRRVGQRNKAPGLRSYAGCRLYR
jgi:NAD(P)-dependent dehydrogenase (short-subunit alcohol dehydrogenase family)